MNGAFVLMLAFYAIGVGLWITGLVRVGGKHWETALNWTAAGWLAYAVGTVCAAVAVTS